VRFLLWTDQARDDLAAIHAFISQDSPDYASVVVAKLIAAAERLRAFPESGRAVPEFANPSVREVIHSPYRIVYRLVSEQEVHILTVHHSARRFPGAV
jgi:toxin ParE1/3/4